MIKKAVIRWNNDHPLDKNFRKKYQIAFNSPQHRETNQIDVLFEWVENALIKEAEEKYIVDKEKQELFDKGVWISRKEELSRADEDNLFDKIDISTIGNESQLQVTDE